MAERGLDADRILHTGDVLILMNKSGTFVQQLLSHTLILVGYVTGDDDTACHIPYVEIGEQPI